MAICDEADDANLRLEAKRNWTIAMIPAITAVCWDMKSYSREEIQIYSVHVHTEYSMVQGIRIRLDRSQITYTRRPRMPREQTVSLQYKCGAYWHGESAPYLLQQLWLLHIELGVDTHWYSMRI